jgi:hypothetical protein
MAGMDLIDVGGNKFLSQFLVLVAQERNLWPGELREPDRRVWSSALLTSAISTAMQISVRCLLIGEASGGNRGQVVFVMQPAEDRLSPRTVL